MPKAAAPMAALECTRRCANAGTVLASIGLLASCAGTASRRGWPRSAIPALAACSATTARSRTRASTWKLKHPDQVWVGDITYLKVGTIYRYLAVVMDKYSRRVVGWCYGPHKDVKLTLKALNNAVRSRRPGPSLVFHTDRGIEYAAGGFPKERIAELGFTQSMNRPGKMTDNAFIESFFHSMKADVFHGYRFDNDETVHSVLKDYLPFYNHARLHSSLDYVSPATFERQAR